MGFYGDDVATLHDPAGYANESATFTLDLQLDRPYWPASTDLESLQVAAVDAQGRPLTSGAVLPFSEGTRSGRLLRT